MIVGGVVDLLSPQPSFGDISDIDPRIRGSYAFNGIQNVNSSGVPVPIIYGLVFSGSILISSGVDTAQIRQSIT
jgi:predicted phage tail protein